MLSQTLPYIDKHARHMILILAAVAFCCNDRHLDIYPLGVIACQTKIYVQAPKLQFTALIEDKYSLLVIIKYPLCCCMLFLPPDDVKHAAKTIFRKFRI